MWLSHVVFILQIEDSIHSKTPSANQEAEALKEELESVHKKVDLLQESLQIKDDENSELSKLLQSRMQRSKDDENSLL